MAAAGLADVSTRDPDPLVLGRVRQHLFQQLAVACLQFVLTTQGDARPGDAVGKRVADPLQVFEARNPWHGGVGRHLDVDFQTGKRLGSEARQLVLEPANLATQLSTREALIAPHSKRRKHVSIEQIWHRPESSLDHGVKPENDQLVKRVRARSRLDRSTGDPEGLVDRRLGHALDLNRDDRDPARARLDRALR